MARRDSESTDAGGIERFVNRRTVLQGLGAGAVGGIGFSETASAHWVEGKPVFCGCGQLCVCVEGDSDVLVAREDGDGGYEVGFVVGDGELDPYPEGKPRYSGDYCLSTDDVGVPDGKIIGLQVAGTRWVNPNRCAEAALHAEQQQLGSLHPRPEGDSGGPCGTLPCEDPGNGGGDGDRIEAAWPDCETVELTGPDDGLEEIVVYLMRCFEDPGEGCPDGARATFEDPDLPMTLGRAELAVGEEEYHIDAVEFVGDVEPGHVTPPDDLDCRFDSANTDQNVEFRMDDRTVALAADDDALSQVTITGDAEFGYAGWELAGPVGHAWITSWAQSEAAIDFPDRDIQRYFDVDGDTDVVTKDVEITFDVPASVGDPAPGEAIETEITGHLFYGLERGTDPGHSENLGDWREQDAMTLRVERAAEHGDNDVQVTWEDCETVTVTGSDEGLDEIVVHPMRCFPDGPCPDGVPGGRSIEDPELPLTIDERHLAVDDVPYYIAVVELVGDVEPDHVEKPDDLDCSFE